MIKKILLCVAMFVAGFIVAGFAWNAEVTDLEERNALLETNNAAMEAMIQSNHDKIVELTTEITKHEMNMLKLEAYYGIDLDGE